MKPDKYANAVDPVSKSKPTLVCPDCKQRFSPYYYRLHRGPSYNEFCPSIVKGPTIDGWEIRDESIKHVKNLDTAWDILTTDSTGYYLDKKYGVRPKKGDVITFYTQAYSLIQGVDINGKQVFYNTKEQAEQNHQNYINEENEKRQKELVEQQEDRDKRRAALPEPFQQRLNRFQERNPNWRRDYESYELYVCEQAVSLAQLPKDKPTKEWYEWFRDLKYDQEKEVWPGMDGGHSGNTFGMTRHLAQAFESGMSDYVVNYHGALAPLVGCEEYGCHSA